VAVATVARLPTEELHRTFTHGLFTVAAVVIAFHIVALATKRPRWGNLGSGLGIGILLHILLDLLVWFSRVEILRPIPSWVNLWRNVTPMSLPDFTSRFASFPSWLSFVIIVTAVLIASLSFLWPAPLEFPMDDTYIHFVYAQNLAGQGRLMFNFASERGVGSTSLLWVLLLAGGHALGLSMHVLAKVLGMASLATVGVGLYLLLCPVWRPIPALAGALLVALSGNMLWFALSGMETMLFLALGVLALLIYREERWGWLGVALGLITLTRPEGLVLAVAIGCIELWRHRGIKRGIVAAGLICALICGPWFGYLLWRTGCVLPTSAVGKQLSFSVAARLVAERDELLAALARFPAVIYVGLWLVHLLEFALGGMTLPQPHIPIGAAVGNPNYTLSLWAIVGWAGVIIPLLFAAGRQVSALHLWSNWVQDRQRQPMIVFLVWTALHNLGYMVFMPIPGTASRYGALNHVTLCLALTIGLLSFVRYARLWLWLAGGLIVIATASTMYWNGVYDANLDHMQNVRIAAAHFVRDRLSSDEQCAAFDVGAIRYYSQRPMVDLGGLVDPSASRWFLEGRYDHYLVRNGVACLILPGRTGATDDGWFDFAEVMGLTTTPLFEMRRVAVFGVDYDRWLQGYLPTNNYQATVTIYRLLAMDSSNE
jgi:hypothetical protein